MSPKMKELKRMWDRVEEVERKLLELIRERNPKKTLDSCGASKLS